MSADALPSQTKHKSKDKKDRKDRKDEKEKSRKRDKATADEPSSPKKRRRTSQSTNDVVELSSTTRPAPTRSPLVRLIASMQVTIPPVCQDTPVEAVCAAHLSPLLLAFYPPFHGVVLGYNKVRLVGGPGLDGEETEARTEPGAVCARSVNEYAAPVVWVRAEFLVFQPRRGAKLEGNVVFMGESQIGLVLWNLFNVSISRTRLPAEWTWVADKGGAAREHEDEQDEDAEGVKETREERRKRKRPQGKYLDAEGNAVEGLVEFRIRDFETGGTNSGDTHTMSIEGTMLSVEEEKALMKAEIEGRSGSSRARRGVSPGNPSLRRSG
ncbi:hypothetical protein EJ06DRAFT_529105 [Trichodelitschia bisporula]|uniref:DNA-directed RNA polymerase subunit n=1 Tax=Trichodelitschia bisporula TaxID=703511 RepID=A0A6G1I1A7_9PEZI|nr:hypothetical protein EJ06DRAFT_529105 [Trichodelitschia bisporula]